MTDGDISAMYMYVLTKDNQCLIEKYRIDKNEELGGKGPACDRTLKKKTVQSPVPAVHVFGKDDVVLLLQVLPVGVEHVRVLGGECEGVQEDLQRSL